MAVRAKVGRNDPCPCGSGKKHKHCCLDVVEGADVLRVRLRRTEAKVMHAIFAYAGERYGPGLLDAAAAEFWLWEDADHAPPDRAEFESAFVYWSLFNWVPDRNDPGTSADWPRCPLGLDYLEEHGAALDAFERRFLEVVCGRPFSFYAVTEVEAGRSIRLRDVLTHRQYTVLELQASHMVEPGELLFARVLPMDGAAIMLGCMPMRIPPTHWLRLIDLREDMVEGGRALDEDDLHDWDIELRELYFEIADELRNPRLPTLRNTDGDPIVPTTLHFDLRCPPREAFDGLKPLAPGVADDALLASATLDAAGELRTVHFNWLKTGNRMHKQWENTVLGTVHIDGSKLVVDVNSAERARTIRAEVETRLGDRAAFRDAVTESIEQQLAARRADPAARARDEEAERLNRLPEVQEHLRAFYERHWEGWLDEQIPALRGATPREAATTAAGRERLDALLTQLEWDERHAPSPRVGPGVAALRARLGM